MEGIRKRSLKGLIPAQAAIEFVRAESAVLPHGLHNPFVLIYYTLDGKKQPQGLRLDLDKRSFIDHFEPGSEREAFLQSAAPDIAELLHEEWFADEPTEPVVEGTHH